jgi:8-amino-7-oxononanoate synthase
MGLFDRFRGLKAAHDAAKSCGDDPFAVRMDDVLSPTEAMIEGRRTILAGTNNYLGLTFEPSCVEASAKAVRTLGTGTTGSRVANGSYAGHKALESAVADFFGRRHAMVFTTGYQANLGIIATLAGPQDYLIIDSDSHASIYDATRLSSATVLRFKHNDPDDLDRRLSKLGNETVNKVIVVEGIYSMRGDIAPLAEFAAVKRKHGAYLVVDEAHSMGVMGEIGRGAAEFYGVEGDVDFVVGTFSKSLGAIGGYCVSDHPEFDILRVACRPYMFTASLPPSIVASVAASLDVMIARPTLRDDLWANVNQLYGTLQRRGFILGPHKSPVVAVHLPDPASAIEIWHELLLAGVYVNLTLPPATPNNTALLRCSVCAAHTSEQLATVADRLTEIAERHGVIGGTQRMAAAG